MRPRDEHFNYEDVVGGTDSAQDEEAQLLIRQELEFADPNYPHSSSRSRARTHTRTLSQHPVGGIWDKLRGPHPPRIQHIRPFFAAWQHGPARLIGRRFPSKRARRNVYVGLVLAWTLLFFSILISAQKPSRTAAGDYVVNLDCVDTLWRPKNGCGVDGIDCRPFLNQSFAFRCPARCAGVRVLNPHPVGPLDINYRSFVIGDGVYRGDSFICSSAIHAGIVADASGGCGRVSRVGQHDNFAGTTKNGLESISFDSYFPLSFSFSKEDLACGGDPRQLLNFISLLFTTLIVVFFPNPHHFFTVFILIFAHVSFASDPPQASLYNTTVLPDHLSMFVKRLLPALFCAAVLYHTTIKRTLTGLSTAPLEKASLWLGGFWFGALSNYTFDWIPLSRLTAHDLSHQPGAKLALALILLLLIFIIAGQIYFFWLEARLPQYLSLYALFIGAILLSLTIPAVSLRLHHYILALLLLPGTSLQTRPSLLYQGILLGLFVNGIARWDFDSVLQTADALRGDGEYSSLLPPVPTPHIEAGKNGGFVANFEWSGVVMPGVEGISALVNDVERFRVFFADSAETGFRWESKAEGAARLATEYWRFAVVRGGRTLDYTRAYWLFANGTWGG